MNDDRCPACGIPWDDLPIGHCVGYPLDGSKPTCEMLPPFDPDIIEPAFFPGGVVRKETMPGTPLSPLPFFDLDDPPA